MKRIYTEEKKPFPTSGEKYWVTFTIFLKIIYIAKFIVIVLIVNFFKNFTFLYNVQNVFLFILCMAEIEHELRAI